MKSEPRHSVDYVTEKEAQAIRLAAWSPSMHSYNHNDMTVSFRGSGANALGVIRIPETTVRRFMDDWKRCGAWCLYGHKEPKA
jgi:hypothetical protein